MREALKELRVDDVNQSAVIGKMKPQSDESLLAAVCQECVLLKNQLAQCVSIKNTNRLQPNISEQRESDSDKLVLELRKTHTLLLV